MPIYEYKCENGHVFDVIRRISDDPLTDCTKCGAPVKKVLHPVNIAFKGSGFYSTDYSGSRTTERSSTDKSDSGDSSASSNGNSEKSDSSKKKSEDSSTKKSA